MVQQTSGKYGNGDVGRRNIRWLDRGELEPTVSASADTTEPRAILPELDHRVGHDRARSVVHVTMNHDATIG
jgi:hypothetical protein